MTRFVALRSVCMGTVAAALMLGGCGIPEESEEVLSHQQGEIVNNCPTDKSTGKAAKDNIDFEKELLINTASVANDLCRSRWYKVPPMGCESTNGRWSFRYLMEQAAGEHGKTELGLSRFVLSWLNTYWKQPVVNGHMLSARTEILNRVILPWREASGCNNNPDDLSACELNFEQAPFVLRAIVNRPELRLRGTGGYYTSTGSTAGELRFVFAFLGFMPAPMMTPPVQVDRSMPLEGMLIIENAIPTDKIDPVAWAERFHSLGSLSLGSPLYRAKLQELTDAVLARAPQTVTPRANGSTLVHLRSADRIYDPTYIEFREFVLACSPGDAKCPLLRNTMYLTPAAPLQEPDIQYNNTAVLQDYLTKNYKSTLTETHVVPATFSSGGMTEKLLAGAAVSPYGAGSIRWNTGMLTGIPTAQERADTRRLFALSTCTGCHLRETKPDSVMSNMLDGFHIKRDRSLSPFLRGSILVTEPVLGKTLEYNEVLRRQCEMQHLLNGKVETTLSSASGRPH